MLVIFISLIQYPLAYETLIITNDTCWGKLTNILVLGSITNATFLIGSIIYKLVLVDLVPAKFYTWIVPFTLIFLLILILLVYSNFNIILSMILISILQVVPYYLTYYDYYLFTEKTDLKIYGLVLGIYGTIDTIIIVFIQYLFLSGIKNFTIYISSILVIIISMCHTFYIIKLVD